MNTELIDRYFKAVKTDDYKEVRKLLAEGFEVDTRLILWNPISPLIQAVRSEAIKITSELLRNGANPNAPIPGLSKTPLDEAKEKANPLIYKLLHSVYIADVFSHPSGQVPEMSIEDFLSKLPYQHEAIYKMIELRMEGWIKYHKKENEKVNENLPSLHQKMQELLSVVQSKDQKAAQDGGDIPAHSKTDFHRSGPIVDVHAQMEELYKVLGESDLPEAEQ